MTLPYAYRNPPQHVGYIAAAARFGYRTGSIPLFSGLDLPGRIPPRGQTFDNTNQESRAAAGRARKLLGLKFDNTNQELQVAAGWARKLIEREGKSGGEDGEASGLRIGIVVPNLAAKSTALERQFLATFCPNGYRFWQRPQFRVNEGAGLAQTQACQDVLSYIRIIHADEITYSSARSLTCSEFIPEADRAKLRECTEVDQEVDSVLSSPWKDSRRFRQELS